MISLFRRKKKAPDQQPVATITNGPGTFSIEAVGESHYQDALKALCGGRTEDGHELEVEAYLVPEDNNPHDDKAVAVVVGGSTVGYLDRETARSFRERLAEIAPEGTVAKCPGLIVGGWDRGDDDVGYFGVRIDLPAGE